MDVLAIRKLGAGASLQDFGRRGWKRFGVPPGGVMDSHAAAWANRLVGNPADAPALELLRQGADFEVLAPRRFGVAGATGTGTVAAWGAKPLVPGERLAFLGSAEGLWTYLAVEGGFAAEPVLGSVSADPRSGIGRELRVGDRLAVPDGADSARIGQSWVEGSERRNYAEPPVVRVWPGPQWEWFDPLERTEVFSAEWEVSPRSDRVGYRLEGARLNPPRIEMRSEPVMVGSIQVPPNGQPIVTMRDGPTVGGYPKIGQVAEESLSWLAQCRPGVRFRLGAMA